MYRALEAQGLLITGLLGEIRGLRQDLRGYASYRPNPARLLRDDDGQKVSPYAYIPDTQRLLIACPNGMEESIDVGRDPDGVTCISWDPRYPYQPTATDIEVITEWMEAWYRAH